MEEEFRIIPSFPDYLVSNFGRVKTKSRPIRYTHPRTGEQHFRQSEERHLKIQTNKKTGYKFHQLYKGGKMFNRPIHVLVSDAFLERPEWGEVINHKDGNKHNNTVGNLEWTTDKYNHEHATITGLKANGTKIKSSILNDSCVRGIRYFLSKGYSHSELASAFGVSRATISLLAEGKTWKHVENITIDLR
jgi:hypothetical protein